MGKPSASCFKIITCGSDSVDHDDVQAPLPEGKSSSGRGWSFRKRSARHRVLSNTIVSESPSSAAEKESPVSTASSYQPQLNLTIPEKTSVVKWTEEKIEVPPEPVPKVSGDIVARKEECIEDDVVDESNIILIQAAVRGFLGRRLLLKEKNVVKLQAAVRGHLVRKHAVGTLRCVQAIVKMQGLVRARRAPPCVEGSGNESNGNYNQNLTHSRKSGIKPNETSTYASIDKLLSNRFARQLMDSTPKNEPINIKCDPLKSDSAWKWLERWMAVSSPGDVEPHESVSDEKEINEHVRESPSDEKENLEYSEHQGEKEISAPSASTNLKTGVSELAKPSEIDDLLTCDAKNVDLHSSISATPASAHSKLQDFEYSNSTHSTNESLPTETIEPELISSGPEAKSLIGKDASKSEQDLPDLRDSFLEQPETLVRTLSRKASNPSFIAAQSKFEELSSGGTSAKLTTASSLDCEDESTLEHVLSSSNQPISPSELGFVDNLTSNASAVQIIGSECGTELSISSTLDSPDRSEIEVSYTEQEPKVSGIIHHSSGENKELETDLSHTNRLQLEKDESFKTAHGSFSLGTDLSHSTIQHLESEENVTVNNPLTPVGLPEVEEKTEADHATNVHLDTNVHLETEVTHPGDQLSPEGSPRSQITIPESQATPSSQVSIQTKKNRGEQTRSNHKGRSSSADRKLDSTPNNDSSSRKSGKRRNSFGSVKPDQSDQEPRDSISVPSYMQATESARAKAIANGSPRSSPDVHDKDIYIKKRQSLPGANGRQGSPRIERSLSQAQQTVKGNGTSSPQDRKWRR